MDYILAGTTGLVGTEVLHRLAKDPQNHIYCLGRRAPKASGSSVYFVEWDFESSVKWPAQKPKTPQQAICTLGTSIKKAGSQAAFRRVDLDFVVQFAREMQKLDAQSFHVVTAHGAAANSVFFYNRVKGERSLSLSSSATPSPVHTSILTSRFCTISNS